MPKLCLLLFAIKTYEIAKNYVIKFYVKNLVYFRKIWNTQKTTLIYSISAITQ